MKQNLQYSERKHATPLLFLIDEDCNEAQRLRSCGVTVIFTGKDILQSTEYHTRTVKARKINTKTHVFQFDIVYGVFMKGYKGLLKFVL